MRTKGCRRSAHRELGRRIEVDRGAFLRKARAYLLITTFTVIVSVGLGEIALRLVYREGMSFSAHIGPMVARFEQDFQFNHYDGPSRGPEVTGRRVNDSLRVLIQGDSITWGQGVKREGLLYSNILRNQLRSTNPRVEVAVLARPGREIDGHLEQLRKWGKEIDPDVVIYQWFINDMELNKNDRPGRDRGWRRFVFPGIARNHSYLWYLLGYRIGVSLDPGSYDDYVRTYYSNDSDNWHAFENLFHDWAIEAKRLTPHVLVALFPFIQASGEVHLQEFSARMEELCDREGIAVIDLLPSLEVFRDDLSKSFASPFDSHPNTAAHAQIAEALDRHIRELWPGVLHTPHDPSNTGRPTG